MKFPKIFILLSTFNRAYLIEDTLNSIINQTYKNWECIIVDDLSEDETKQLIEKYIKIDQRFSYYLKSDKYRKGLSGSRNYGLDIAFHKNAEYIQFFDDDDIMHPQKLEMQIRPFMENEDLDLTICCYRKFHKKSTIQFDLDKASDGSCNICSDELLRDFYLNRVDLNSPGPLWKAEVLKNYRFCEHLEYAEEREFYLRIFLNETINYRPVDKVLFWYRKHDRAITSNLYGETSRKKESMVLFERTFFREVLTQENAPYFILKSLAKQAVNNSDYRSISDLMEYIKNRLNLLDLRYMKLLAFLFYNRMTKKMVDA
ncbi:glycosyltransferase family A protein [Salegentibacter chungangensis]|uniref:Glycosyltransferase family A protein n=1 Tax=Salegentibacter chungangensis TaxID=1335724 RepID=A0ABW3NRY0_9FLAO